MDNGFDGNNQGFQENGGVSGGETERTEKNADQNQGGVYSPQQTYYQNQQNQAPYGAGAPVRTGSPESAVLRSESPVRTERISAE